MDNYLLDPISRYPIQRYSIAVLVTIPLSRRQYADSSLDYDDEDTVDGANGQSPQTPELVEYEAYMSRELPRKVRKELEVAIERLTGPIEENLKNQLEKLIRNCQERLSKDFLQSKLRIADMPRRPFEADGTTDEVSTADEPSEQAPIAEGNADPQCAQTSSLDLTQYAALPEPSMEAWPLPWDLSCFSHEASSDSGYISNIPAALPSDPWWVPPDFGLLPYSSSIDGPDKPQRPSDSDISPPHTREGNERGNEDGTLMGWKSTCFP